MIRRISTGVIVGLLILVALFVGGVVKGADGVAPQELASATAVPEVVSTMTGAVTVIMCKNMVALYLIDSLGGIHWVPMEGMTDQKIKILLSTLDADAVHAITIPCGIKDGTPL